MPRAVAPCVDIVGWGLCLPPAELSNADLATILDTSDDWIVRRTGIERRPISHVGVSQLAYVAAAHALACAAMDPDDIDLIVLGSCTADDQMPNSASAVQRALGARRAAAMDVNTACTSFMYSLSTASALIKAGAVRNALVVGADTLSAYMDWDNRTPSVLFGDGAGAVVLKACDEPAGIVAEVLGCVTSARDELRINGIGSKFANAGLMYGTTHWDFNGPEIFRQAVGGMAAAAREVLAKAGVASADVGLVIPHQANLRIVEAVARRAGIAMEKVFTNMQARGNLSSASIPVALVEALAQQRVAPGSLLLLPAFGGGMTWSAHVLRWGKRTTPLGTSPIRLPPCERTALEIVAALRASKGSSRPSTPPPVETGRAPREGAVHPAPATRSHAAPAQAQCASNDIDGT
ncbi:MAG: beta-ketoacyl-ACP synthase 3 [Burkholderiales bacterium]|nr:beta-ketoacyl-ACP synthase 3 [Burkholderiales bacterium]